MTVFITLLILGNAVDQYTYLIPREEKQIVWLR